MISVSILICAYNEEKNINNLLVDISRQKKSNFVYIEKFVIVSDGSTDNTNALIKTFESIDIELISNIDRYGKSISFNLGKNKINSDYILSLDADIRISGDNFIENLGTYIINNSEKNIGLTGVSVIPQKKDSYNSIEKASLGSYYITYYIRKRVNNFRNFYSAHGRCLLLNKELYSRINLPNSPGTDQYMYFSNLKYHMNFGYCGDMIIEYKVPSTFRDYIRQSSRFPIAIKNMKGFFGVDFVESEVVIPYKIKFLAVTEFITRNFLIFINWIFFYFLSKVMNLLQAQKNEGKWEVSISTK